MADGIGSGLTDDAGVAANKIADHSVEALEKILHQFKGKVRLEGLISSFVDQVQDLENAFWDLFTKRTLADSKDAQLDGIGEIVGEDRRGRTDAQYRTAISVRILVNRSDGRIEDLYTIIRTAQGSTVVVWIVEGRMSLSVEIHTPLVNMTAADLVVLLRQAKMGGVKLDLVYTFSADASTFEWSDNSDAVDNAQGWGSTTNGAWGGDLASVT